MSSAKSWGRFTPLVEDPRFTAEQLAALRPAKRHPGPPRLSDPNPQLARFGAGPAGTTCRHCAHLEHYREGGSWLKCALRRINPNRDAASSDHKAGWPACAKYEQSTATEQKHG